MENPSKQRENMNSSLVVRKIKPACKDPAKTIFDDEDLSSSNFLVSFSKLHQFQKSDTFTDVKFSVQGKSFAAHKVVLSVHSPVFEAMFSNPMMEATSGHVLIDDVKPRIFEILLTFMYTGIKPKIDQHRTAELFMCADKYGVNSLMDTCEKMLCKKMTAKNVIEMYLMAEAYERPVLRRRAFQLMGLYMTDIVKTEGWNLIQGNTDQLKKIIKVMMKRYESFSKLGFISPRGRGRELKLGTDEIRAVIVVDRDTKSHLRPHEFKFSLDKGAKMHGYVTFIEDKNDNDRIVAMARITELSGTSSIQEAGILFEVTISSREAPHETIDSCQTAVWWVRGNVHQTMGSPRYIIYEEKYHIVELPKTGLLFFEIKFCENTKVMDKRLINYEMVDSGQYVVERPFDSEGSVHISGINYAMDVPLERLSKRTYSLFVSKDQKPLNIPDTPKEILESLIRIMYLRNTTFASQILPPRDTADLHMLKAACKLRMDYDIIIYLEHALVWDLDPCNCLDMIEAGSELGLGYLKHGALLYFKVHLDRIIQLFPEKWSCVKPSVLKEILLDLSRVKLPPKKSYLPDFLVSPRKYV